MTERKLKIIGVLTLAIVVMFLHVKLFRFSEIVHHGALRKLICLGRVVGVDTSEDVDQILSLRILSGQFRGEIVNINNIWIGRPFSDRVIYQGDVLLLEIPLRRQNQTKIDEVRMGAYFRTPFLLYFGGVLGCLIILVAGLKGVRAILTLFLTALSVFCVLVPMTVRGFNPIGVALCIATLLTIAIFVIIAGFSFKVISGVLATLGGLAAVAILSFISQKVMALTGLAEEFGFLELGIALWRTKASHHWDFAGILSAGMILGAVGAMMDVGMSISSSVHEVKRVNPNVTVRQAIRAGLNVGRDIMGTMADTLIFAYLGAHMIVMLLPTIEFPEVGRLYPFLRLVNDEATAAAIVQAVVGTIGLVLTVPIAATISGMLTKYTRVESAEIHEDLPSAGELENLWRANDSKSKVRLVVPTALILVLVGTVFTYHRINHASATITEHRDSNGHLVSRSEYAKGKILRLLESNAKFLFESGFQHVKGLDNRKISKDLRAEFEDKGIVLSGNVSVAIKPWKDSRWLISDNDREQTYAVRQTDGKLKIYDANTEHHILELEMLSGLYKGERLILRNIVNHNMPLLSIPAAPGHIVLCRVGGSLDKISLVNIVQEYGRDGFLVWMVGLMFLVIIFVGRVEGVRTAFAMLFSGIIIYFFMLPLISRGANAIVIVTLASGLVAFTSLVFVIGPSRKTFSAVFGTMGGILVSGLFVMFAQNQLHFSGLENAISADIVEATRTPPFDFRQLLVAGMLMGVLGVAVDGAIEVSSSMEEIRRANPNMRTWKLIASGMNVGTDILGTMVNTLVFAYLGARLLLVMAVATPDVNLFQSPPIELLSVSVVAAEVVRLLAGTLGLVLAIPITAMISAFWEPKN